MPSAQSLFALHAPGWHDLNSWATQSIGSSSHFSPGRQAGAAQAVPPLTWHVQPFTQSVSTLQEDCACAGREAKPNRARASSEVKVKRVRIE
jgi:hypothetical protein